MQSLECEKSGENHSPYGQLATVWQQETRQRAHRWAATSARHRTLHTVQSPAFRHGCLTDLKPEAQQRPASLSLACSALCWKNIQTVQIFKRNWCFPLRHFYPDFQGGLLFVPFSMSPHRYNWRKLFKCCEWNYIVWRWWEPALSLPSVGSCP